MSGNSALSLAQVLDQFRAAMHGAGLSPPDEITADGKLHRWRVEGDKAGSKNGWYVLHADGLPAGEFGSWKAGLTESWCAKPGRELSDAERTAHRERIEAMRKARDLETETQRAAACKKASRLWAESAERVQSKHSYLVCKAVRAYGLRQLKTQLVVPVRDVEGKLHGLQFIAENGSKKFLTGTAKQGHYHSIGKPRGVLLIAEGYATAATVHQATGHAVAVAFDAGNLRPVADALRGKYPALLIVVAADNDHASEGNPGLTKAREAAAAVGGRVAAPEFSNGDAGTDWNDYAAKHGLDAVRMAFTATPQDALADGVQPMHPMKADTSAPMPDSERMVSKPRFSVGKDGIWHHGFKDGEELPPYYVAPPLSVSAYLRDVSNENWGRLLEFTDKDGRPHQWGMPMRLLSGGCEEMRGELLRLGYDVPARPSNRNLLTDYIQQTTPQTRARCVERTGWHERVFVMPERTIGDSAELVLFQSETAATHVYSESGELADWRSDVADLCRGNSRLLFAVSSAFAAMLVHWAGEESGGFHLRGGSSSGKTTALRVAASVYGGPRYMHRWRATDNAMEFTAAGHSDTLLILDELAQIDPRVAGETAYMLANGEGKQRAQRMGGVRALPTWRLLFLSAGEIGLAAHMHEGGKRAHAGQETRLAEIPADAGKGHGLFDELHGHSDGATLSRALTDACTQHYGTPAIAFINALLPRLDGLPGQLKTARTEFLAAHVPNGADGQVKRVGARFALVAAGGELATELGITGWEKGDAVEGARKCFTAWLDARGGIGNLEPQQQIRQVRFFLEQHGKSRFENWSGDGTGNYTIQNRAGFRRGEVSNTGDAAEVYYALPNVFKEEICKGLDHRAIARTLAEAGCLKLEGTRQHTRKERLPQMGLTRCYVITPNIFQAGDEPESKSA